MHFLEYYLENVIKYDLINKFHYKKIQNFPKLESIILNFGCKNPETKMLLTIFFSLELITMKKGKHTFSKTTNILLKVKKGNPVGCKIVLKKRSMYIFLSKLLCEIFPKLRDFNGFLIKPTSNFKSVTYKLKNPLLFNELEQNYPLFNRLPPLTIIFLTNSITTKELLFLLNSFKLPIKKANVAQLVECNLAKINVEGSNPFFCFRISGRVV